MSHRKLALLSMALVACLAVVAACSDGSPSSPAGAGTIAVRMTDAPVADATEVNVHITGLTVKRSGAPVERISNDIGTVDLLTLQDTSMLLVTANVTAGDYEFIQVELSEDDSSVVEEGTGTEFPLSIASDEIKVLNGFHVNANGTTEILLDFDAEASLRHLGNGEWMLTPVISQANASVN